MGKVLEFVPKKQENESEDEKRLIRIRNSLDKITSLMADIRSKRDD